MKNPALFLAAPTALMLLLSGCASDVREAGGTSSQTASAASKPAASSATAQPAAASEEAKSLTAGEACDKLTENGRNSLLYRVLDSTWDVYNTETVDTEDYQEALDLKSELSDLRDAAPAKMELHLTALLADPTELVRAVEASEDSLDLETIDTTDAVTAAGKECLTGGEMEDLARTITTYMFDAAGVESDESGSSFADEMKEKFPGYPLIVDAASLDYRVASAFELNGNTKAVALAPGVYAPYNKHITDLDSYYENSGFYGDTAMIKEYFSGHGGSTSWSGVNAGPQEP